MEKVEITKERLIEAILESTKSIIECTAKDDVELTRCFTVIAEVYITELIERLFKKEV